MNSLSRETPTTHADEQQTPAPAGIKIRSYRPGGDDARAFRALNEEWIGRHFTLEAKDREILGDPENTILRPGGRILMVEADGQVVGCVAITPVTDGVHELSKMSIAPALRGQGLGRRLLQRAIAEARTMGANRLFLGSSTKLPAAVHLYGSLGFQHVPRSSLPDLPYTRADVFMLMEL